jgi:hypothetical protein
MLTACATSDGTDAAPIAAAPVIQTRHERVVECPADLDAKPSDRPTPAADAVIQYNLPGGEYLAGLIGWGEGLLAQITDAQAECARLKAGAAG